MGATATMIDLVDPFIGSAPADLPPPEGLASTWWWPKPPIGNTHPGATHPFGMVSACSFSGAYPTGYGVYDRSTEGVPTALFDRLQASGFTHFQQSGTGAIRKYYNYLRVTPMMSPLDDLGESWTLSDEVAEPGYYAATLGNGVRCEITVGPKSAVHRYTFPEHRDARIVIDASHGGLAIDRGETVPLRASLDSIAPGVAAGHVVMEGVPVSFHVECDTPDWRQMLWYDRRLMAGGSTLRFDSIRPTTLRPFGFLWAGPVQTGGVVEVRIGFSLRSTEQARRNLHDDVAVSSLADDAIASLVAPTTHAFERRRGATRSTWADHVGAIRVESDDSERKQVFATALYHSLIKPCFAPDESPFWPIDGPFVFDLCTMWDVYRTQLPLVTALFPDRAVELANALLHIAEEEGNLPIGYRMARGADRFSRQGSALAHTFLADVCALGLPGVDWDWALCHMDADLRRQYGEEFVEHGVAHPITHTLDLAFGYHCTALVARHVGDDTLADQFDGFASRWVNAYDPATGLILDSSFYEGGKWNYSFRLGHDMAGRIALAGGDDAYIALLDRFFGVDADPVKQLGESPSIGEIAAGYELDRFEGLNNEPDMEAPWSYHWVGRPDRTAEIVHAIVMNQFGTGPGGLPGNDDSGGISSWYVWASLGLFPVAGQQIVLLNAPSFARSRLRLGDRHLVIDTTGFVEPSADAPAQYVQGVTVDGRPLDRSWMPMADLVTSSRITIDLGPEPSAWATATVHRPPSHPEPEHTP
ncbi:glycoside hydrolase domain-containing protein [Ilumatobacter coccineus]|uniref:Putative glycosidase n=1 Tax=Ilumatobacter coccineus (strain NBRC 103263 / KCTC 29153 / YM16-304) TaxID=1313172 RepID=A0A6C7EC98_ILUCY|nr:glycoside hydrolase domain-containing protein [Ilumatobacter coccineus]BAN01636.1 putative glycosidase [Ilumatobacter coccineus YM16-304]